MRSTYSPFEAADRQPCGSPTSAAIAGRWLRARVALLAAVTLALTTLAAQGQWVTESYPLQPGWNSIWLHQDCTYAPIETLLAGEPAIEEVWHWNAFGSTTQFITSPAAPVSSDVAWNVWRRGNPTASTLARLPGNAAYLIKVADTAAPFSLALTGKPLAPRYRFQSDGLNFLGFPMKTPDSTSARSVDRFFSFNDVLKSNPPVFQYIGGPLRDIAPKNPAQVTTPRVTAISRGKAYWVNATSYSDYYGPLRISTPGDAVQFGDKGNYATIRVKNVVDRSRNQPVTVTFTPRASDTPPAGQAPIAGPVPLLVRETLNANTLDYTFAAVAGPISRTLAPGEEIEVVFGLDRTAMTAGAGAVYQSLVTITDSLDLISVDLPVNAVTSSLSGLWIGSAEVSTVDQIIGQTNEPQKVTPAKFPIRLILHRAADGATTLLQQVYVGTVSGAPMASTAEAPLRAANAPQIARFSSATFPLDLKLIGSGQLGTGGSLSFNVALGHNANTNPFVHTYHPDHDNLDARFENQLPAGEESYPINRSITFGFQPTLGTGTIEPGWGSTTVGGTYTETISGLRATPITVSGTFTLRKVTDVQTLTSP